MPWQLLAAISVLSISVGALFQKTAMKEKDSDPVASAIIFQFLLGFIALIYAAVHGYRIPPPSLVPYFAASGLLYAVGTVAYFRAVKLIEASEVTVIGGAGVLVTVLFSYLFLGDRLTAPQVSGILFILSAVVIMNYSRNAFRFHSGTRYTLLGTGSYGLAVVFDSYIIRNYDAVSFLPLACFIPGAFIWLWQVRRTPAVFRAIRNLNTNLVIYTVLYAVQAVTFYTALERGALVSQMSPISRVSIILTVILATIVLGERTHLPRKFMAAVLTTFGVLLVT